MHYNTPIHLQPAAKNLGCRRGQFHTTERLSETILALPANQTVTREDIIYIGSEIWGFFGMTRSDHPTGLGSRF